MLAVDKVAKIERLLQEGKSERAISRQLKVARVTVNRINRRLKGLPDKVKGPQIRLTHGDERDAYNSSELRPKYLRCPGCGGLQQEDVPCHVCFTRKRNAESYNCYMAELLAPSLPRSPLSSNKTISQNVWLWKSMKVERIDFDTLSRAARCKEKDYKDLDEKQQHLEPQ
jgi:hypothetical protein